MSMQVRGHHALSYVSYLSLEMSLIPLDTYNLPAVLSFKSDNSCSSYVSVCITIYMHVCMCMCVCVCFVSMSMCVHARIIMCTYICLLCEFEYGTLYK